MPISAFPARRRGSPSAAASIFFHRRHCSISLPYFIWVRNEVPSQRVFKAEIVENRGGNVRRRWRACRALMRFRICLLAAQQRHHFARMVGAAEGRVAAVIGGQQEQVVLAEQRFNLRQRRVEFFQRLRIARHIAAMAVNGIKIDEVDEDQPVYVFLQHRKQRFNAGGIARRMDGVRQPAVREDIFDFANAPHVQAAAASARRASYRPPG